MTIPFGSVPSRRLGRSLGINNIPPKNCTYACVYCQVGRTSQLRIDRHEFYNPDDLVTSVRMKIKEAHSQGEQIDFLTFVPDGEPTLDIHLGEEIEMLRSEKIPIAIITNASLLWNSDVRKEVQKVDWVSVKVDTADDHLWNRINRPHRKLSLTDIHKGIKSLRQTFRGKFVTETMLVHGVNDSETAVRHTVDFLHEVQPDISYISIPIRPPAEEHVSIPAGRNILHTFHIFQEKLKKTELLTAAEENSFATGSEPEQQLLSITAVHPMRESSVKSFLQRSGEDWSLISKLIKTKKLICIKYGDENFYLHKIE